MKDRLEIAKNWLPRYTGMPLEQFGDYVLLTNFHYYVNAFAAKFNCDICGVGRPMQAATNSDGLSIVNFGIGSANVATVMGLLSAGIPEDAFSGEMRGFENLHGNRAFHPANCRHSRRWHERTIIFRAKCRPSHRSRCTSLCRKKLLPAI